MNVKASSHDLYQYNIITCLSDHTEFGLVTRFINFLQFITTINSSATAISHTLCNSLHYTLSLLSQLCILQSSGNGLQWQKFPFLWVPELSLCLRTLCAIQESCLFTNLNNKSSHSYPARTVRVHRSSVLLQLQE
jgi:hypothetical protein